MPGQARSRLRWVRRFGPVALAVVAGVLLALAGAGPAAAHAELLSTDPVDGAVLADAPAEIVLTFNEPVVVRDGAVRLFTGAGRDVDARPRAVDTRVVIGLPDRLPDGTYVLSWRVVSADSHPVAGGFSFSVGAPDAGTVQVPVAEPTGGLRAARQATEAAG
jgi:copper transport protein